MGDKAFEYCASLLTVTVPENVTGTGAAVSISAVTLAAAAALVIARRKK
ncbi:MAG: hypothetical protein IKN17_06730 [Ruminococcus sp.]|nr:hypothetical protein [Ruminococcus sp.]